MQELAYGLANAIAVLDAVRESGQIPDDEFPQVVGRISFFIDAGVRFVEEMCKMRAFTRDVGPTSARERYGVTDEKLRRFRYGMQVNSLGLTEEQPENNVQRIVLEMLGVTLSKDARARAMQLPCWNEALGLPTPWDQQWSLRIQQVLAYESDLLEYGDLFDGSKVVEAKVAELRDAAEAELQWVLDGGGSFAMIDEMKGRLVQSHAERVRRIESGELKVVGVNSFTETAPSPLADIAQRGGIVTIDPEVEQEQVEAIDEWRAGARPRPRSTPRSRGCARSRPPTENLVPATIALAQAGGTVGEWAGALRDVFGEYRAPTGVGAVAVRPGDEMQQVRGRGCRPRRDGQPDPDPRRQARPRRPLERRRADRGRGPRRRDGGRLPGHPAHARPRSRPRPGTRTSTSSDSRSSRARTSPSCPRRCGCSGSAGVTAPVVVGGIIPDADRAAARTARRRAGLHTQGLPTRPGSWARSPTSPSPTGQPILRPEAATGR